MLDYVEIIYTNWRGETTPRKIVPPNGKSIFEIYQATNSWHSELTWMFDALDLEKGCIRSFSINGVSKWSNKSDFVKVAGIHESGSGV